MAPEGALFGDASACRQIGAPGTEAKGCLEVLLLLYKELQRLFVLV